MNLKDFTGQQREALLDLAMLAMYADGHLASAEDERVNRLLEALGVGTDYDRNYQYDAAVGRVRGHSTTVSAARSYASTLAQSFTKVEHRQRVLEILSDLLASDSKVVPQESTYLALIREAFQL